MAAPIDFLRRFRSHVVPGAPAAVPAPADRAGELAAEVAPIFAALEATQRDAEATISAAERDAAAVRASATEQGQRLIAAARAGADAARDDAARRRLADGDRQRERVLADGRAEADRIARVAAGRMPVLIDDVVRRVLSAGGACRWGAAGMSAGWVAATVRGRGLARRRLGEEGAKHLARSGSLPAALAALGTTSYGPAVRADMDLVTAQRAVSATVLWHLRVLAGWGPPLGAGPLRALAAGFEIANVSGHLARLAGEPAPAPYALGSMATAGRRSRVARSVADVRRRAPQVWVGRSRQR